MNSNTGIYILNIYSSTDQLFFAACEVVAPRKQGKEGKEVWGGIMKQDDQSFNEYIEQSNKNN